MRARLGLAGLGVLALAGCASQAPAAPPAFGTSPQSAVATITPGPAPSPAGPPITASGCTDSYQNLNSADSVVHISATLTNNSTGIYTVNAVTAEFVNSSGDETGSITTDSGSSAGIVVPAGQTVAFDQESDTIYLNGSYAPACKVVDVSYAAGDTGN